MPHGLRKIRKTRGSRTQGYGRVGQHRCHGSKGFKKAGRHKAGWSYVLRFEPDYFGKKGFTSPQQLVKEGKIINVGNIDELAEKFAVKTEQGLLSINLTKLGYQKLLGKGKITKSLTLNVPLCTKSAAEKVEKIGGHISVSKKSEE